MKLINKISTIVLGLAMAAGVGVNLVNKVSQVSAKNVTSDLTFTDKCNGSGTASDNVTWTVQTDGIESTFDKTKGIHYGTSSSAVSFLKLKSSSYSGTISSVVVNASGASKTTATISCTIGGVAFGTQNQSLTSTAADYTFAGEGTGVVQVSLEQAAATKALYVKSIIVTYDDGEAAIAATGVTLDKSTATILTSKTITLVPTVAPADATNKTVTWSSNKESVATVSDGVVTGVSAGEATITATTEDGGFSASCVVTVNQNPNKIDNLNITTLGFPTSYGDTKVKTVLSSASYKANGTTQNSANMQMRSSNSNSGIVSLTTGGLLKSVTVNVSSGTATWQIFGKNTAYEAVTDLYDSDAKGTLLTSSNASLTFEPESDYQYFGFRSASGAIYISSIVVEWEPVKPTSIDVADDSIELTLGGSDDIVPEFINGDLIVTETEVEYSSDNAAVTVDAAGHVEAVSEGTANITIKSKADSTVTKTVAVTVSGAKTPVTSVLLDKSTITVEETHTESLAATVLPADATVKDVTWSSLDKTIATVDQDGIVTGVKAGTATIKAESAGDETKYAECIVTVVEREVVEFSDVTADYNLVEGGKYIVVGVKDNVSYVMDHYFSGNNVKASSVVLNTESVPKAIKEEIEACYYTLVANDDGTWSFFDGAKYLYAAGGTNNSYMKTTATINDNAKFKITFDDSGLVSVVAQGEAVNNNMRFNYNGGNPLFSCYGLDEDEKAKMDQIYLFAVAEESLTAEGVAQSFMMTTNMICPADDKDLNRGEALAGMWNTFKNAYNGLDHEEKVKFLEEVPTGIIKAMLERYDYIVAKYSLENYIVGHTVSNIRTGYIIRNNNNNAAIVTIAVVSIVSITTLGVLITLKKRKALNK